jgi:hypothetical protein
VVPVYEPHGDLWNDWRDCIMSALKRTPRIVAMALALLLSVGSLTIAASASAVPADPTVTRVSPDAALETAGQTVTLAGANLDVVTSVEFQRGSAAPVPAESFNAPTSTQLVLVTPALVTAKEASYDLVLGFGAAQQVVLHAAYTSIPEPKITSVRPVVSPPAGGRTVTIITTLVPTASVTFGGVEARLLNSQPLGGGVLAIAPAHAPGVVDLTVTSKRGYSITVPGGFTYSGITDVSPNVGSVTGGSEITVSGHFTTPTGVVIGGQPLLNPTITDTAITGTVPAHAAGPVDVTVESSSPANNATLADGFRYLDAPAPTSLTPSEGGVAGGTPVTVTGAGFTGATGVAFGGVAATDVSVVSDTELTAVAPQHEAGPVNVEVTNPAGSGALSAAYTYVEVAAPVPTPAAITPTQGDVTGGTSVTVTGTDFTDVTGVTFGGVAATDVTVVSDTELTAVSPTHAVGAVDVNVISPGGDGVLRAAFTYVNTGTPGGGGSPGDGGGTPGTRPDTGTESGTGGGVSAPPELALTGTPGLGIAAGAALLALAAGTAALIVRRRLAR